jgi:hypothetical protein
MLKPIRHSITESQTAKSGRRIIGFFGLAFGSLFLIFGLGLICAAAKLGFKQSATSAWPSVEGKILSNKLRKSDDIGADSPLMYEFQVNGVSYRSTRIFYIAPSSIDYSEWIQLANGFPREGSITVYYRSDNPNESVLVSGAVKASWNGLGSGALFAGFAAFWMTAWWGMSNWLPDRLSKGKLWG